MTDIQHAAATPQHEPNLMRFGPIGAKQLDGEREEYGTLRFIFDRDAAAAFLSALDPKTDKFTFQTFDDDYDRKDPALAKVLHGTLPERWDELCRLNAKGAGIFTTINETNLKGRSANDVVRVRALFVDCDEPGPRPEWHLPPHVQVESSPDKWHGYWLVKDCELDYFKTVQGLLIQHYGSDPAIKDLPRVMRLSGFFHQKVKDGKRSMPFRTRLDDASDREAYAWTEVTGGLSGEEPKPKSNDGDSNPFEQFGGSDDSDSWTATREARLRSVVMAIPTDEKILTEKRLTRKDGTVLASHDIWVDVGRGLEREGWGEKGFAIWHDWSKQSPKYNLNGLRSQWKSFRNQRSNGSSEHHITIGTIYHYAKAFAEEATKTAAFAPEPYICKDPKTLPRRDWLYGNLLIRKYVAVDFAPGGTGKSNQSFVEACAMASGKNLLGVLPKHRLRVWYWSLEDTADEVDRRIEAVRIQYDLKPEDLNDYLFVNHGRSTPLVIGVTEKDGVRIFKPVVNNLIAAIREAHIDVVIVDPFVSSHHVKENDNTAMDAVAKEWNIVCEEGDCAVRITHHTRKGDAEITSESGRGASALRDAARICRVFNVMTKEDAAKVGVEGENRRRYYRTYDDKRNMTPPSEKSDWFYIESVSLNNAQNPSNPLDRGDSVGVTTPWVWPEDTARVTQVDFEDCRREIQGGRWRQSSQAEDWVGGAIADALGLKLSKATDKERVKAIIKKWLEEGKLKVVEDKDETRHIKKYVEAP
jgi:AAA domain/Primase C terminal 2 (PriCT-2)